MQGDPGSDPRVHELRAEIASTDHEIVSAVNRRLELVRRLKEHKAAMGYDFLDKGREEALLAELERRERRTALGRRPTGAPCGAPRPHEARAGLGLCGEVFGLDVVEELLELLDHLFLVHVILVLELDRALFDDRVVGEDRSSERTARAMASLGRESISISLPFTATVMSA